MSSGDNALKAREKLGTTMLSSFFEELRGKTRDQTTISGSVDLGTIIAARKFPWKINAEEIHFVVDCRDPWLAGMSYILAYYSHTLLQRKQLATSSRSLWWR